MRRTYDTPVYIGGPLDGQEARPRGAARWSHYRDDAGNPVRASLGAASSWRYARSACIGAARWVYVHRSVWPEWRSS